MLDIEFGQATHPGKIRTNNEDAFAFYRPRSRQDSRARGWLFVLADGVGGLERGEVAAAMAVEVISEGFANSPENSALLSLLPRLIRHANAAIHDECIAREHRGRLMASTVVACALRHDQAYISNVGDSRCYLVRDQEAVALTRDHTLADEQHRLGLLTSAEMADSESRHILTRSLGPERFVTPDTTAIGLHSGDILILCSDGLFSGIPGEEISRIASRPKLPEEIARELVEYSVGLDGSDNTTAQVIAVRSVEPVSMYRGRYYPRPES